MRSDTALLSPPGPQPPDFSVLFREHSAWLWAVVRRLGVAERYASDVVHDLLIDVFRNLGHYDPSRPLRPWLYGFAVRAASTHRRRAHVRRERPTDTLPEPITDQSPEGDASARQRQAFVLQLLDRLDESQREVLVMVDLDELPVPEVAEILKLPLNTAYSRLRLARARFAELAAQAERRGELP